MTCGNTDCSYADTITINVNQQVTGTITTSYGAPLANSLVNIYNGSSQLFIQNVFTDNNGFYTFNITNILTSISVEAIPNIAFPTEKTTRYQGGAPVALYAQNDISFSTEDNINAITGTVFRSDGAPLQYSKVVVLDANYNPIDTVPTDINGNYSFSTYQSFGYVIAVPDTLLHPDQLIFYPFGEPVIQDAMLINLDIILSLSIYTLPLVSMPNGNQTIGGVLLDPISNAPEAGIRVLLMTANETVVGVDYTSATGSFDFNNIDTGTYRIWVDQLGIDNDLTDDIPFLSNNSTIMFDSLLCFLHSNYLEVNLVNVNTKNISEISKMSIQPNPATDNVYLNIQIETPTQAAINIYDISGQLIGQVFEGKLPAGEQRYELSSTLQSFSGICIVKIQTKTGVISKRLLYLK